MIKLQPITYTQAFAIALVVHIVIFSLLTINPRLHPQAVTIAKQAIPAKPIIEAVSIDESMVMAQVHQRRQEQLRKQIAQQKRQYAAKRKQQQLQQQIRQVKNQQKKAKQDLHTMQQKITAQHQRVVKQKQLLAKMKTENIKMQQHLQLSAKKMKVQQQQVREQARLRMLKIAAQKREKAKAELQALKMQHHVGEINRYAVMIKQAISHNWIFPNDMDKKLSCRFQVVLAPSGDVLDVKVLVSSGHAALDRAAKLAIYKASPLPVPKDPDLFSKFKVFNITMRPEKVIATI